METKVIKEKRFCEFYWKMKELYLLGKKYHFGRGISLSSPFTEKLCRFIYDLEKYGNKTFDATNNKKQKIEIKATLSKSGTTTMSNAQFDLLYWMYFSLDEDKVYVYLITGAEFRDNQLYEQKFENKERANISIRKFVKSEHLVNTYSFEKLGKVI